MNWKNVWKYVDHPVVATIITALVALGTELLMPTPIPRKRMRGGKRSKKEVPQQEE